MFFLFSKIAGALIAPLNVILILLVLATGFMLVEARRMGGACTVLAFIILAICGFYPGGYNIMAKIESGWVRPDKDAMPERVDGIIVLGGMFNTDISASLGFPAINGGVERVIDGLWLARLYPDARLIFSGGEGMIIQRDHTEGDDMKIFLNQLGADVNKPLYESRSRNTFENALYSYDMAKPKAGETWILVTSTYHMTRAIAVFESQGWDKATLIPWPTDYQTAADPAWGVRRFDVLVNMYLSHLLVREFAGYQAYRMAGKITSPR